MKGLAVKLLMRLFMQLLDNDTLGEFKKKAFMELKKRFDDPDSQVDDFIFMIVGALFGIKD